MMIGGIDIVFQAPIPKRGTLQDRALDFFAGRWPDCVVEADELPAPVRPSAVTTRSQLVEAPELYIYPTDAAAASWNENGAAPDNANQMIHLLFDPSERVREFTITAVVGESTPEMEQLVNDLRCVLQRID